MCKENLELYDKFRECPESAKKKITGGNLNGKTDINPMWRIKRLTEEFGPVGFGWRIEIVDRWIEEGADGVRVANVQINLYVCHKGTWSAPIPGIGGAMLIDKQSKGLVSDDDAFKKAYTDAQSVACKALGIAADVYYERDPESKYNTDGEQPPQTKTPSAPQTSKYQIIKELVNGKTSIDLNKVDEWIRAKWGKTIRINELTDEQFAQLRTAVEGAK